MKFVGLNLVAFLLLSIVELRLKVAYYRAGADTDQLQAVNFQAVKKLLGMCLNPLMPDSPIIPQETEKVEMPPPAIAMFHLPSPEQAF